jgi:glycosyltransferase involved in cell wall biosynthesis
VKVLLVYDCVYPETLGGVEHRNHQLALALAARGHQVTVTGWAAAARSPTPGVEIVPLPSRRPMAPLSTRRRGADALRLARAVLRLPLDRYDVVETANIPFAHVLPLAWRCILAGKPLVVTWHEVWGLHWRDFLRSPLWPAFAAVELLSAQVGAVAIAVSPLTAERLRVRRRGDAPILVPNGVPVAAVRAAATGKAPGAPLIYAGRLLADKQVDVLLRAVAILARERRDGAPLLSVIGDGPERRVLEQLAADLAIAGRVEITGRLDTPEEVWARLGGARVAVQPSRREGFGMFPLEAMAAGLPVVYCDAATSAVASLVRDGVEGVAVPADPGALAAVLGRLLADEETRGRLAAAARRRAEEHDWGEVARRVEGVLLEVAGAA